MYAARPLSCQSLLTSESCGSACSLSTSCGTHVLSEDPQRNPGLKRKAWLAVFLGSALFWVVVALLVWNYWG
jgi:hypothetical protein